MGEPGIDYNPLYRYLVEQSSDGLIFADPEGLIKVWNPGAERIFGFTVMEAMGKSLDIIIPERFREAHWAAYRRAMATGKTRYTGQSMPTRSMRNDGTAIYVELTFAIIRDQTGNVIGALANVRDITEKYLEEREMRRRLAAKDARS